MKVLYHASCFDGFCAAWAIWKRHPNAEFIPVQYGNDPPAGLVGEDVVIVDFSYSRPVMEQLIRGCKSIVCLDHHKTAEANLEGLPFCHFDMTKSGGRLAWDYFHDTDVPWLVNYTEDRDLWKWELAESRLINDGLKSYPFDFEIWDSLAIEDCRASGVVLTRYLRLLIDGAKKNAKTINGLGCRAVNCTMRDIISDVAGELAEEDGIGATYFYDGSKFIYSLRSRGEIDVSEIAQRYGGGGHKNAAGFSMVHPLV